MKQNRFLFLSAFFIFAFFGFFSVFFESFAQSLPGNAGGASIQVVTLRLDPEVPAANDTVTATLVSYAMDLNTYPIRWFVNGKEVAKGTGLKTQTFRVGSLGSATVLRAEIQTPESEYGTLIQTKTIAPASVDLLWQADTYTPPFYKGKALPSSQSTIKVVAAPTFFGKTGIAYRWEKESASLGDLSGTGKNVITFTGNYAYNLDNIRVIASSLDGLVTAEKIIDINIETPKILFYENRALEGVRYEKELGTAFKIPGSEVTVHAEPYFFSFPSRNQNAGTFVWTLDGKKLENNPDNPSEFILRTPNSGSGNVLLKLEITNENLYMQKDVKNTQLQYSHSL